MRSLLALAALVGLAACTPQATTANGVVEGVCIIDSPVKVNGFYGIPFGAPPARFEKPQPPNNWSGVKAVKNWTAVKQCSQILYGNPVTYEDCLYLNVYAPAVATGLPVFVVVHGGAFNGGSVQEGTAEHIAKNLAAKGIVVVAIQYRVGPIGFCSTYDSVMPGNYGMWDAKLAFEWVRDNIAAFGGNPNDVTAYGGSAGATLIDAMHLSPLTTNLFHKMALFSGAARDIFDSKTKEHCEAWATNLGLTWTDSASFKAAMLTPNQYDLRAGWQKIGAENFDRLLCDFAPVIDGDFFPAAAHVLRANTQPKPSIFGISFLEGAGMAGEFKNSITHELVEDIVDFMVPASTPNRALFQNYFLESYRNQGEILEPTAVDKHAFQAAFGERTFAATMDAVLRRNFELFGNNQTVYRYVFNHLQPAILFDNFPFISYATHSFDQWYSIGQQGIPQNADDQTVIDIYTNGLVNFAKTGNPNGAGATALPVEWKKATAENPSLNYVIDTTPSMDPQFFLGRPNLNNILAKNAGTFKPV